MQNKRKRHRQGLQRSELQRHQMRLCRATKQALRLRRSQAELHSDCRRCRQSGERMRHRVST